MADLGSVLRERCSEEELPVTDSTCSAHLAVPLDLTERELFDVLEDTLLVSKYAKFVGTFLASFVSTELAIHNKLVKNEEVAYHACLWFFLSSFSQTMQVVSLG